MSHAICWPADSTWCPTRSSQSLLGCTLRDGFVEVDDAQQTSLAKSSPPASRRASPAWTRPWSPGPWPALPPPASSKKPGRCCRAAKKFERFAARLNAAFALRPELLHLPSRTPSFAAAKMSAYGALTELRKLERCQAADALRHGPMPGAQSAARQQKRSSAGDSSSVRPPLFPVPLSRNERDSTTLDQLRSPMHWTGVMPAMTTAFHPDLSVDHEFMAQHAAWLWRTDALAWSCSARSAKERRLRDDEKIAILRNIAVKRRRHEAPVVAAISSLSTANAVSLPEKPSGRMQRPDGAAALCLHLRLARNARARLRYPQRDCRSPACSTTIRSLTKPTSFPSRSSSSPKHHENLHAVKESSADIRRVAAIRSLLGERLNILVGVDDALVEGDWTRALSGWIAGLVNAFPAESVDCSTWRRGKVRETFELYRWFLPLLRMDTVPKFVQLIKLAQQEIGVGSARVRPPRLELAGDELSSAQRTLDHAILTRPHIAAIAFPQPAGARA